MWRPIKKFIDNSRISLIKEMYFYFLVLLTAGKFKDAIHTTTGIHFKNIFVNTPDWPAAPIPSTFWWIWRNNVDAVIIGKAQ